MTPDPAQARRHIELLTGSATTPVCFRFFSDKKEGGAANSFGKIDKVWGEVLLYQGQGMGVFVVVNPGGNSDADITAVRAFFVDKDGGPLPSEWHVEPDFLVVRDATRWHAYWLVASGFPVAEFKAAQQRLAAHYDSDPTVCNPSRVMRLAGSVHQKGDPVRVVLKELRAGPPRPASELLNGLVANVTTTGAARVSCGDYTGEFDAEVNIERAVDYLRDRAGAVQGDQGDEWTMGTAADLRKLALSEDAIHDLMAEHFNPKCDPPWETEGEDRDSLRYMVCRGIAQCEKSGQVGLWALDDVPLSERFGDLSRYVLATKAAASAPAKSAFEPRRYTEWLKLKPAETLIEGFLSSVGTTILYGDSGSGKSALALDAAVAVAWNVPFVGKYQVKPRGLVFYSTGEGRLQVETQRIQAICKARKLNIANPKLITTKLPSLSDPDTLVAYAEMLRTEAAGQPVALIVLDTAARLLGLLDDNATKDGSFLVRFLEDLAQAFNCQVVVIDHSGKDKTKGLRGTTAKIAGVDAAWHMAKTADHGAKITPIKLKDDDHPPIHLNGRIVIVKDGVPGSLVFDAGTADEHRAKSRAGKINAHDVALAIQIQGGWPTTDALAAVLAEQQLGDDADEAALTLRTNAIKKSLNRQAATKLKGFVDPQKTTKLHWILPPDGYDVAIDGTVQPRSQPVRQPQLEAAE
jgi:hypothetical protein